MTLRISGFFRDAFPHVIALLDDAIAAVAVLDEPHESNFLRAHALADQARHGDWRRATTRMFGSKPGAYGAGLLQLIDARNWRGDADLAEVYAAWGGYAYGRGLDGAPGRTGGAFRRIEVAVKNVDTREHDILDSDDYFQYHGGMVATVRSLTGRGPPPTSATRPPTREVAHAGRGDPPRVPVPGGEPAVDRVDDPPRLQGRLRTRRDRRLPVRLRRHRRRGRTGCTSSSPRATCSTRSPAVYVAREPLGLRGISERLLEAA